MAERLQKLLARAGHGSRREVEAWIRAGRLTVNGRPARLGERATPRDRICLDGRPLSLGPAEPAPAGYLYHKPAGRVCSRRDPQGRPTVFEALPPPPGGGRWVMVGRLDVPTLGLLLFVTDGALAHRLMHPSSGIAREYAVRVRGRPGEEALRRLRQGVVLEEGPARFEEVAWAGGRGSNQWFRVLLREGRYREVRRLWEAVGHPVSRLIRVRFGPLRLPPGLPAGKGSLLTPGELAQLYQAAGLTVPATLRPRRDARWRRTAP